MKQVRDYGYNATQRQFGRRNTEKHPAALTMIEFAWDGGDKQYNSLHHSHHEADTNKRNQKKRKPNHADESLTHMRKTPKTPPVP